jgi:hypothetical protein
MYSGGVLWQLDAPIDRSCLLFRRGRACVDSPFLHQREARVEIEFAMRPGFSRIEEPSPASSRPRWNGTQPKQMNASRAIPSK